MVWSVRADKSAKTYHHYPIVHVGWWAIEGGVVVSDLKWQVRASERSEHAKSGRRISEKIQISDKKLAEKVTLYALSLSSFACHPSPPSLPSSFLRRRLCLRTRTLRTRLHQARFCPAVTYRRPGSEEWGMVCHERFGYGGMCTAGREIPPQWHLSSPRAHPWEAPSSDMRHLWLYPRLCCQRFFLIVANFTACSSVLWVLSHLGQVIAASPRIDVSG